MFKAEVETLTGSGAALAEVLNLGCGWRRVEGALNVDLSPRVAADLVHDLNRRPWPLPDGHFREVLAYDVLEHLEDVVAALEEIHRVCRDGAVVRITLPHFSCANAFTDPTHRHQFGRFSFGCFTDGDDHAFYTGARFRERSLRIFFYPSAVNRVVARLANRYPAGYERRWAWVFPAWFMSVELEVVKGGAEGAA